MYNMMKTLKTKVNTTTYIVAMIALSMGIIIGKMIDDTAHEKPGKRVNIHLSDTQQEIANEDFVAEKEANLQHGQSENTKIEILDTNEISIIADDHAKNRIEVWEEMYEKKYEKELHNIGIQESEIPELVADRKKLLQYAMIDKVYRQMMQKERYKYLDKIQEKTTEEQFNKYLEYEKLKPAVREVESMEEEGIYIANKLEEGETYELQKMMVEHGVITKQSWDGPLDPLPNPLVGNDKVLENIINRHTKLSNNLPKLVAEMESKGFHSEAVIDVEEYFLRKINKLENSYIYITEYKETTPEELYQNALNEVMDLNAQKIHQERTLDRIGSQFKAITDRQSN